MARMRITLALEADTGIRVFEHTIETWMQAPHLVLEVVDQQLGAAAKAMSMAVRDKDSWRAPEADAAEDQTASPDAPSAPAPPVAPDSNMAKTHRLTEARGGPFDGQRIWIETARLTEGRVPLQASPDSELVFYRTTTERTSDGWADIIAFEQETPA